MGGRLGLYRGILDVAEVIREELGPDTCGYNDKELSRHIEKLDPVGFTVVQGESNTRNVGLSIGVSDIDVDSLRDWDMPCARRVDSDSTTRVIVEEV